MANVVFLHPDLGIGGAERAMVDAGLALKSRGHHVHYVTSHHDPTHCFAETRDGTLNVTAVGDWLPRSLLGRCYALCAYMRMVYAALYLVLFSGLTFDLIVCDQISACIVVLKLFTRRKVVFYCHFPDMLLTQRESWLKRLYRGPLDWLEERTTALADLILVNSQFTAGVVRKTFPTLSNRHLQVVYPVPDVPPDAETDSTDSSENANYSARPDNWITFLSINRYERKKNLELCVHSFKLMKEKMRTNGGFVPSGPEQREGSVSGEGESTNDHPAKSRPVPVHLVVAGGYDRRVQENVAYHSELTYLASQLDLKEDVTFLRSVHDTEKRSLLRGATCLLYTPTAEHFGIVPVEAMQLGCPVIAVASGGPLETIDDGITGFLIQPDSHKHDSMVESNHDATLSSPKDDDPLTQGFAEAMLRFVKDPQLKQRMGEAGRKRVMKLFSFAAFTERWDAIVHELLAS